MSEETGQTEAISCKVTYFIGKMLAKGGVLSFNDGGLLFSPTALDKMMGAIDIPISLSDIEGFHYDDALQKKLEIITPSRKHRFIGSGLGAVHKRLIIIKKEFAQKQGPSEGKKQETDKIVEENVCFNCMRPAEPSFKYCPYCRTQLKLICDGCKEVVNEKWISCPNCNYELRKP